MTAPTPMPVRLVPGRLPQPGFSSRRANWPRLRHSLAVGVFFAFTTAHAGGLEDVAHAPTPCPPGLAHDATMTGDMLAQWRSVRAMTCGRPVFVDRLTGQPLTDDEVLARVFNGHSPAVIPLPAGGWLLLAGIAALVVMRRRA